MTPTVTEGTRALARNGRAIQCVGNGATHKAYGFGGILSVAFSVGASALMVGTPGLSMAQQRSVSSAVEEVLVTARRREESLQEVPIAITAMSAETLEERSINNMENLNTAIPNIAIGGGGISGPQNGSFRVRAIPGVAVYVDGVVKSGSQGLLLDVVELERIEVLRGPQGTLFGKNAIGGAIQFVSQKPREEFGARVKASVGSYQRQDVTANVDVPLADTLLTKVTVASLYRGGFVESQVIDRAYGSQGNKMYRGMVQWKPTDRFDALLIGERTDWTTNGQAEMTWDISVPSYTAAGYDVSNATQSYGARGEFKNTMNMTGDQSFQTTNNYGLTLSYDLTDALTFRSITGGRSLDYGNHNDLDGTQFDIFQEWIYNERKEFSEELQLLYTSDRLSGTAGVYYFKNEQINLSNGWVQRELTAPNYRVGDPLPAGWWNDMNDTEGDGYAAFAEFSYKLTDAFTTTLGLRYSKETFSGRTLQKGTPIGVYPLNLGTDLTYSAVVREGEADFDALNPRISLQYQFNPDIMGYASYSQGFGAGGFNTRNNPFLPNNGFLPYDPETLDNYEAGLRSDLFDGRLRLNATVFYGKWKDIQVGEELAPAIVTTTNAGEAEIKGFELEGNLALTDNFRMNYAYGYLDAKYTNIGRARAISLNARLPNAPEASYSVGAEYAWQAFGGDLSFRTDYGWRDETVSSVDVSQQMIQEAYGLLGARLGYTSPDGNWNVALSGTNLTNEMYQLGGFRVPNPANLIEMGTVGRPREWAITFGFNFD